MVWCGVCVCVCVCMECYPSIKTNEIMLFAATWMQFWIIKLSEGKKGKTNNMWYHLYVELKYTEMNLCTKQKQTHREQSCWQGQGGMRGKLGLADVSYYV